jgi:hypothetical protein
MDPGCEHSHVLEIQRGGSGTLDLCGKVVDEVVVKHSPCHGDRFDEEVFGLVEQGSSGNEKTKFHFVGLGSWLNAREALAFEEEEIKHWLGGGICHTDRFFEGFWRDSNNWKDLHVLEVFVPWNHGILLGLLIHGVGSVEEAVGDQLFIWLTF